MDVDGTYFSTIPAELQWEIFKGVFYKPCHYCGVEFVNTYWQTSMWEEYHFVCGMNLVRYYNCCPKCFKDKTENEYGSFLQPLATNQLPSSR